MNIFRRAKPMTVEDSGSKDQRKVIRKLSAAVRILLKVTKESKFRIAENPSARAQSIFFELCEYPDYVLRARGNELFGERNSRSKDFVLDSSFYIMPDLWHIGFVAFESVHKAAHYIRLTENGLILDRYDGTNLFKEEASFLMSKASRQASMKRVTKWIQSVTCNDKESGIRRKLNLNDEITEQKSNGLVGGEMFSNIIQIDEGNNKEAKDFEPCSKCLFENVHCQDLEIDPDYKQQTINREQHVTFDTLADNTLHRKKVECGNENKHKNSILKNKLQVKGSPLNEERNTGDGNIFKGDKSTNDLSSSVHISSNNRPTGSNINSHVTFQLEQLCEDGCYLVEGEADNMDQSGQQYFNGPDGFVFKFITVDSDNFIHTKGNPDENPIRKNRQKLLKKGVCYQNMSLTDEI